PARRAARSDSARVAAGAGLRRCGVSAEHIGQQRELLHEVRFDVFERALRDGPRLDAIEVLSADTHRGVARLAPPEERVAQELLAMLVTRLARLEVDDLDSLACGLHAVEDSEEGKLGMGQLYLGEGALLLEER